jgi:putative hydrolase of the HAD superfamily
MTNHLPKAVLIDMDDTIICLGNTDDCWRRAVTGYTAQLSPLSSEEVLIAVRSYADWFYGDPARHRTARLSLNDARRHVVTQALLNLGRDDPALADEIAQSYIQIREDVIAPFPDALATLTTFRERGVKLALVTNGEAVLQRGKIERFKLAPFFDCILVEGEFGCGKPDERVYRHVFDELGMSPKDVWMVGDNLEWDVAAPQRLGIFGIWHDFLGTGLPEGSTVRPNRIIRTLPELLLM